MNLFKKKDKAAGAAVPAGGRKKKRWVRRAVALGIAGVLAVGGTLVVRAKFFKKSGADASVKTATVTRQTITETLSASGTISPKNTYNVTSMADGEVTACYFEEGDQVTEGQVLYEIDASSMSSKLSSAQNSLSRAQSDYNDAVEDYQKAQSDCSGNTVKSSIAGYVKDVKISAGDRVGAGTELIEVYDDTTMEIRIPFLNVEAQNIAVGNTATLTLSDTLEQLEGTVVAVGSLDETMTGGRLVRYVTVSVSNPGGLTSSMSATAGINGYTSAGEGTFTAKVDTVVSPDLSSQVTCEEVLVHEGDKLSAGTPIFRMKASDAKDLLDTYKKAVNNAEDSVEQAQSSLDTTKDNYDNYTITAPISGTVVTKSVKVGDNIQNLSSSTALAVIYDLSCVTFEMDIDELDIANVSVGQKVAVTADAFENQTFDGEVTNVSMEGTSSNGVTYYPVTVTINDYGGLLPGMNVEGVITLDSAENVLAIPVDALQRGNKVYVKDSDSEKGAEKASAGSASMIPDGFHEVSVETGLISEDYVEIKSGDLNEGDVVYVTQSTVSDSSNQETMPGGMGGGAPGDGGGPDGGGGQNGGGGRQGGGSGGAPGGMG